MKIDGILNEYLLLVPIIKILKIENSRIFNISSTEIKCEKLDLKIGKMQN